MSFNPFRTSVIFHKATFKEVRIKVSKGSIQSSSTPDPGYQWESNKLTVRHHKRKPRGQPFFKSQLTYVHIEVSQAKQCHRLKSVDPDEMPQTAAFIVWLSSGPSLFAKVSV